METASHAPRERKRLGELLVSEGYIQPGHVDEALQAQEERGGRLLEVLMDLGHLDMETFARFLSTKRNIPSINLAQYQIESELCSLIPREFAVKHEVFPVDRMGKLLTVGMVCPLDTKTLDKLSEMTGLRVKAMLCSAEDLRSAIARYYPGESGEGEPTDDQVAASIRLSSVARLVRQIESLPALPESVRRVREAMADPAVTTQEVAEAIALDPSVSARVLHLANSAAYGFPHAVDDIGMAVTLLGMRETYMVVVSSAVLDVTERSFHFDYEAFRQNAVFTAAAARAISRAIGEKRNPAAFTAGLLHAIGQYALSEAVPHRYENIDSTLYGDTLLEEEQRALGIAHPEAGYLLAERWDLPGEIAESIRFQYTPDEAVESKTLTAVIALAVSLKNARREAPVTADELFKLCQPMAEPIGLGAEECDAIYGEASAALMQGLK